MLASLYKSTIVVRRGISDFLECVQKSEKVVHLIGWSGRVGDALYMPAYSFYKL